MSEEEEGGLRGVSALRGRGAVAASILGVLLIGGYFAASPGGLGSFPTGYLISAGILVVTFWFPATRVGSVADLGSQWLALLVWVLAWTLVWDLTTSGIIGERELLQEWWVVYPASVVFFGALLAFHAAVTGRVEAAAPPG